VITANIYIIDYWQHWWNNDYYFIKQLLEQTLSTILTKKVKGWLRCSQK